MEADSLGIDKNRIADLNLDVAVANGIISADALADALRSALQQTEADPMTERRREGD
jgi:hypothetical protein